VVEFLNSWNQAEGLPTCQDFTPKRRKLFSDIQPHWRQALAKVAESDYLKGSGDNGWTMDIDWFLDRDNFSKVLEGKYKNRTDAAATGRPRAVRNQVAIVRGLLAKGGADAETAYECVPAIYLVEVKALVEADLGITTAAELKTTAQDRSRRPPRWPPDTLVTSHSTPLDAVTEAST